MKRVSVLLRTLMLSTSQWNTYKNCKDKKKRGRIVGNAIGMAVLYMMLMVYSVAQCIGYGKYGLTDSIPVMCALVISVLGFFLTFLKVNGYLFNFKEYDMLMSLPFKPSEVAACKFLYMYLKSLPWYFSVSISMMIVYGVYSKASVPVYLMWAVSTLFLPLIPMVAASFLGFIIAKIGSGFKNKTVVQSIVTFIIIVLIFGSRFFLEDMFRNNKTAEFMQSISSATDNAGKYYIPVKWFTGMVNDFNILYMLLLVVVSLIIFVVVFTMVGVSYRKINSAMKSHSGSKTFVMEERKARSVIRTIAFKEFKRMTGSTVYMTNASMGELFCLITGIAVLFVDVDKLIDKMFKGAPLTKEMLFPAIPFIIYLFIGMASTTTMTPSLEGKNYWIVQSLPISKKNLYKGKMLFNMMLTVPFAMFTTVTFSISAGVPFLNMVLYVILGLVLCSFSTTWGCVCGIRHMRLDWENEVEVVKQGAAVTIYLLPNMFVTMALMAGTVFLGTMINSNVVTVIFIMIYAVLAGLSYLRVLKLCKD